eukprot:6196934-Pleurochrysis_carterae.AAC.5
MPPRTQGDESKPLHEMPLILSGTGPSFPGSRQAFVNRRFPFVQYSASVGAPGGGDGGDGGSGGCRKQAQFKYYHSRPATNDRYALL